MTAAVGTQSHRAENHPTGLDMATAQFDKVDKDGRDDGTGKNTRLALVQRLLLPLFRGQARIRAVSSHLIAAGGVIYVPRDLVVKTITRLDSLTLGLKLGLLP
ncbi:hypothetical protein MCOR02_005579 [Pyricularia oryzae]|uniref:Uncharacterized protein n=1 Tax=Pyricularia oryzae TaxID=318829 RepID=A0A4P7NLJ1_PYROR|nr:hypothetical protein MCOR02_005579 [Pyricularia oryzae]QBZ63024.1 hypothetical protein PoMZ_11915 [Pyricularia oryzae]